MKCSHVVCILFLRQLLDQASSFLHFYSTQLVVLTRTPYMVSSLDIQHLARNCEPIKSKCALATNVFSSDWYPFYYWDNYYCISAGCGNFGGTRITSVLSQIIHASCSWLDIKSWKNRCYRKFYRLEILSQHSYFLGNFIAERYFFLGNIIAARKFDRPRKISSAKAPSQVLLHLP